MGEQWNLTEPNVDELKKKLEELKKDNPDLGYRFFEQKDEIAPDRQEITLNNVMNKLEDIERQLNYIFGEHFLVDGKWSFIKLNNLKGG